MAELEIITGYRGVPHITSRQDQGINRSLFGPDVCILTDTEYDDYEPGINGNMSARITGNNTVTVSSGYLSFQGCVAECLGADLTFESGTPYKYRQDLIVARYTKDENTGVEAVSLEVIKGTESTSPNPTRPPYEDYNINQVPALNPYAERPIHAVFFEGVSIASVVPLAKTSTNLTQTRHNERELDTIKDVYTNTRVEPARNHSLPQMTLPSSTDYSIIGSFGIDEGCYLLVASAFFSAAGTTGTRVLGLSDTEPSGGIISRERAVTLPSINTGVYGQVVWPYVCTTPKQIYIIGRQNSGQNVDVSAAYGYFGFPRITI